MTCQEFYFIFSDFKITLDSAHVGYVSSPSYNVNPKLLSGPVIVGFDLSAFGHVRGQWKGNSETYMKTVGAYVILRFSVGSFWISTQN